MYSTTHCHLRPKVLYLGKRHGRIRAEMRANQVVKRGRVLDPRVIRRKIPQVPQRAQNRRRMVRHRLAARVEAPLLNYGLGPRRHDPRRHAPAQAVKRKRVVGAARRRLRVRLVVRAARAGRLDVVVEAARLVKRDDPERLVPLGPRAQRLVDILDELLAVGHAARRVHRVGAVAAARRVDVRQVRQVAVLGVLVEGIHEDDAVRVVALVGPLEPPGVLDGRVDEVVLPLHAELRHLLEDGFLLHGVVAKVVFTLAGGSARAEGHAVGVGRLRSC